MPNTSPLSLHHTTGEYPVAGSAPAQQAGMPGRAAPPSEPTWRHGTRSADDVYSFLTSFTAGVQRGLDDTRPPEPNGEDDGSR
jgi:hypothetical protein